MAICNECKLEMNGSKTCTLETYEIKGEVFNRNKEYHDNNETCHDCGIVNGNFHHPGCDMERCPKCGGQSISCDC